jgi:predicted nucleic acid-binding protein
MSVEALPSILVIDASVGLKWIVEEEDSDLAGAAAQGRSLYAPALFAYEAANALQMRVRRGLLTVPAARDAFADLARSPLILVPASYASVVPAMTIAGELSHTVYDSAYLALAAELGCPMLTADRRLHEAAKTHVGLRDHVILLGSLKPAGHA